MKKSKPDAGKTTLPSERLKLNTAERSKISLNAEQQEFLEHVKGIINYNKQNPHFDLSDLAKLFSVTPRTIQRKLKACGTTFIVLKNEERVRYLVSRLQQGNVTETLSKMANLTRSDW